MLDLAEYRLRFEGAADEEKQGIFEDLIQENLRWRVSREGSIVYMLQPEYLSCAYEQKALVLRYPMLEWEMNPIGTLHGGIIATMMDNQGGLLTQSLSMCGRTPTVYLNVSYLSALFPGEDLIIRAWATHLGKRMADVMAEARSQKDNRIIATAMAGYMLIDHTVKK